MIAMQNPLISHLCRFLVVALFAPQTAAVAQHTVVLLWPAGAPGSEGKTAPEVVRISPQGDHIISSIHSPSVTVYLPSPDKATGAAVIIAPGGGHRELWIDHEGYAVAEWLSDHGVAAFVLKYRLARETGSTYTVEGTELQDIQRAIRLVRSRAAEWGLDPGRIGVIGFSAGGELAALAATRPGDGNPAASDSIDRLSALPAFQALLYPAIPHDLALTPKTPPAFLACGQDDRPDIAEGVPELYLSMKRLGIPAELHVFAHVGHGFGIRSSNAENVSSWPDLFHRWLASSGLIKGKE
jgi:endo-1,4-beta-xylanase